MTVKTTIEYTAEIANVKEVILSGKADLAFWRDRLAVEQLCPYDDHGGAQVQISVTRFTWMGLPSREFTISAAVGTGEDASRHGGYYLIHAFNSSALLAWAERTFFQTPYYPAQVESEIESPVWARLVKDGKLLFSAKMAQARTKLRSSDEWWEGPVYLPSAAKRSGDRKVFYAGLGGYTDVYAFDPAADTLELDPAAREEALRALTESRFAVQEWRVRGSAVHKRSRTYRR